MNLYQTALLSGLKQGLHFWEQVLPDLFELWKLNVTPPIKRIEEDLERWFNLTIYLMDGKN